MRLHKFVYGSIITTLCLALSVFVGSQTASTALSNAGPSQAVQLFERNGLARENLASASFRAANSEQSSAPNMPREAVHWARTSYLMEPLTPDSHAVLALSMSDRSQRSEFGMLATALNRRSQMLLGVVLEEHVRANDYPRTIKTLDQILRVRPKRNAELFPVLVSVFQQQGAVEEFTGILDGSSPWHRGFVNAAIQSPEALPNLFELRKKVPFNDIRQDELLVRNLAKFGLVDEGFELYSQLSGEANNANQESATLIWKSSYPPFDWNFADLPDFRAQKSLKSINLEVFIRPGQGGIFAEKLLPAVQPPFSIEARLDRADEVDGRDFEMATVCENLEETLATSTFEKGAARVSIDKLPLGCNYIWIRLTGRSWTGGEALRAEMPPIEIQ